MKELFIAITIPICTGLTYLAYKHPRAIRKLDLPSSWFKVGPLYLIVHVSWYFGASNVFNKLLPLIPKNKVKEATALLDSQSVFSPLFWFILGCWIFVWIFFLFLSYGLPFLLKDDK